MTSFEVPARQIPMPSSISPQAQAALTTGPVGLTVAWPPIGDVEAWHAVIAAQDEAIVSALVPVASQIPSQRARREFDGAVVYTVTPTTAGDDDRVVLELHGGAFILLGGQACEAMTALGAEQSGLPTWGVDYRMPPDHPYPWGLDDCVRAYRALLAERDASRIIVRGGSAGGNLAAALVVRARDEGLPVPAAVVLNTPEVDLTESGDSFQTNLGVDTVCAPLGRVNELYAAGHDLTEPYLSPLFADLTGFPPTLLTTGTRDLFLSNTVRMHRALRRADVAAELHVLEAAPHAGFFGLAPEDAEIAAEIHRFVEQWCPRLRPA